VPLNWLVFVFVGQGYFAGTSMTPSTVKRVIKCLSVRRACIYLATEAPS
jgi:hypothetical protein